MGLTLQRPPGLTADAAGAPGCCLQVRFSDEATPHPLPASPLATPQEALRAHERAASSDVGGSDSEGPRGLQYSEDQLAALRRGRSGRGPPAEGLAHVDVGALEREARKRRREAGDGDEGGGDGGGEGGGGKENDGALSSGGGSKGEGPPRPALAGDAPLAE